MFWYALGAFGVLAGMTTVLFGFGGGFVAVPLLYGLIRASQPPGTPLVEAAMQVAVATSTAAMIFGAGLATWRRARVGALPWAMVRPLLGYVALGAVAGAALATVVSGAWVRWAFIAYLSMTLVDAVFRPGFLGEPVGTLRPLGRAHSAVAGTSIGAIAAFLGVGGSVMSVPLMRRRGASMATATALANPLSLPMAVAGTLVYSALAWGHDSLGRGFAGYVDLPALALLVAGAWCGIALAGPLVGRISDTVHARSYLVLLGVVLVVMVLA
ncbi:sulfite exporter TauE/SafE family protein [Pseudomonas sp. RIT-To-2]|uniref:sulfite exporter TauE/SafE family protein n=1 Tax=Pseudomonas sp. RIT-To-2 TaxID=3462541 RepID=UPI0024138DF3